MVLHNQFAGLASLRSSAPPPWPSSENSWKFLPMSTLLSSSSRLPLKALRDRSTKVHLRSATRRLSVSAAAAADPEYPKPSYEHSIFLHILDKHYAAKKSLRSTADSENLESYIGENVDVPKSTADSAKEDFRGTAGERIELGDGGGKEEVEEKEEKQDFSTEQLASSRSRRAQEEFGETAVECNQLEDGGGKEEVEEVEEKEEKQDFSTEQLASSRSRRSQEEFGETTVECNQLEDGGGKEEVEEKEEKQDFSTEQLASSRSRRAQEEFGETAVEWNQLGDGGGNEKVEVEEKQEFPTEQFAFSRSRQAQEEFGETALQCNQLGDGGGKEAEKQEIFSEKFGSRNAQPSAESGFVNDGFPEGHIPTGQIRAAEGDFSDTRASEIDLSGQEAIGEERKEEESVGFHTGAQSTSPRWSTVEDRSHTGFKELGEGTESGLMFQLDEEEEVEDVSEYAFGDSGVGAFTSAADEQDFSISTTANGASELSSLGEERAVEEPSKVSFWNTNWNFDVSDPQTEQYSGRRQGLKVGRQVFLTGEHHYNRWMPNSEAESNLQPSFDESPREEELLHPISQIGESGGSLAASDGDDETSGEREDEKINLKEDEDVQLSLDTTDKSGGESSKDLLVEFLTKRSEHWGESTTRPFLKDASVSLKAPAPKQTDDILSAEEKFLFTSAEVMTTQDQLPESSSSSMGDGKNPVPKGLIEEILSIAKSLRPNASLETFLTPFCGQISTNEGNVVLKLLGENHFVWPMLSFFQWMRLHAPCLLDSRSFCTLFTYLGKLRMADQALLQYENMPDDKAFHCVQVYNSLLGALSRAGRPEKIPVILEEMERRNVERDPVTYSILITATKGGKERYDRVWTLFDDLLRAGVKPSVFVYGSLIKAFCDEGHLKQALLVSLSMEKVGLCPNVIIYNTLIDAHARVSQLEEAEGLFLEMKQRGLHPTESTYNALINGYGRNGQLDVAEELVLEMQKEGLKPNVATYTSLISAYGKHFSSEKALNVFLRMKKSGLMPNTQTYTALINAYAEGGWHEKAQSAFDNMVREKLKPTVETYTALLDGYRRAGDLDMVRSIWNTMKADGCKLTRITYCTVMDAFSKHGLYVEARDVMEEFKKRGLEPDTMIFNMLLNAYARGGLCTKLRKVLWEMEENGCEPDSFTYCTMIYSYIRHRDFTSAFEYDNEMLEKGLMPSRQIYGKMRFILNSKYAEKVENDKKANAGQNPEGLQKATGRNPQRKKTSFKRYQRKGPRRGSERAKALWKDKEERGRRPGSVKT